MTLHSGKSGFSLIEFSILLVIIGLLCMGISSGDAMARNSRVQSVVAEMQMYKGAIGTFDEAYASLPGDMTRASQVFASGCAQGCDGDGDGRVEVQPLAASMGREHVRAWQHLSMARVIPGSYSGVEWPDGSQSARFVAGENVPESTMEGGVWTLHADVPVYGRSGNRLNLSRLDAQDNPFALPNRGIATTEEAATLDAKVDDGNPATGQVVAYGNRDQDTCVSTEVDSQMTAYMVEDTAGLCNLSYFVQ